MRMSGFGLSDSAAPPAAVAPSAAESPRAACPSRPASPSALPAQRQHQALGEQLAQQAPRDAPTASRTAISFRAPHGARQQQVGEVGAGDHQHQADRRQDHSRPPPAPAYALRADSCMWRVSTSTLVFRPVARDRIGGDQARSARALASDTPGFSRPATSSQLMLASSRLRPLPLRLHGKRRPHVAADQARAAKAFGATPMTVNMPRLSTMVLPRISGSDANAPCQSCS